MTRRFLQLATLLISFPCHAMKSALPSFPMELIKTIVVYIPTATDRTLDDTLATINSVAGANKILHTFINDHTDRIVKQISTTFGTSNEFVARMLKTEAAAKRSSCQKELLGMLFKKNRLLNLRTLAQNDLIDWNFTYSYTPCLDVPQCKKTKGCKKKLQCSHIPAHLGASKKICCHIATQQDAWTPLMIMMSQTSFDLHDVIKFLLAQKEDINALTKCGKNSAMIRLIYCRQNNRQHNDFLNLFLDQPAFDINHQDNDGNTYLVYTLLYGDFNQTIRNLVQCGANPLIFNKQGQTAFSFLDSQTQSIMLSLISQYSNNPINSIQN